MCKAHSKVAHIKQQKYFRQLKRRGYNKDCVLYPRPLRWWKYFCRFICVTLLWALHIAIKQQFIYYMCSLCEILNAVRGHLGSFMVKIQRPKLKVTHCVHFESHNWVTSCDGLILMTLVNNIKCCAVSLSASWWKLQTVFLNDNCTIRSIMSDEITRLA